MVLKICAGLDCDNDFEAFPANKRFCSKDCKRKAESLRRNGYIGPFDDDDLTNELTRSDWKAIEEALGNSQYGEEEINELQGKNEFLRKENNRLYNAAVKNKYVADEVFEGMLDIVKGHVQRITVPLPKNLQDHKGQVELVCNPWNSDPQLGKVTPSYNSTVALERIERYTDKIIENTNRLRESYYIRKAHIWFLGDIVEGEGIFPTQPHVIDQSIYGQIYNLGVPAYASQIRRLLEVFEEVVVVCVIGNHGRLSRYSNPESNMDRMLYATLSLMFENEPRVKFVIPHGYGESMFWAVDKIGTYSTLLIHGDQMGPPTSAQSYWKKVLGWKTGGIPVQFDDVAMGHWHQNTKFTLGTTVIRIAGSTESHNTFAQERLGVMGIPSQHMQMIDPTFGVAWESDIFLD